jgi:NADPH-dependent glutamate synthase beta subunit-like oxidoreductase
MVCVVTDRRNGSLLPACSSSVQEGMDLETESAELDEARKTALDLLLSEHVGDCEAPCRIACPAFMDIPGMNRLIAAGRDEEAYLKVTKDIALPAVLGRICPAPCESVCRRKSVDSAVSICLLKRYTADTASQPVEKAPLRYSQKVAVIGAGPAGLAAANYLQIKGIQTTVFDCNEQPGGALRYEVPEEKFDKAVLDLEIERIRQTGVLFLQNQRVDKAHFESLCAEFDAVVLAIGYYNSDMDDWGLDHDDKYLLAERDSHRTNFPKVFAIGNTLRSSKMAVRSAGQGKEVAISIEQLFKGEPVTGQVWHFNSSFGKLLQSEAVEYLKESTDRKRLSDGVHRTEGFSREEARLEAERCLHCDCRKAETCILRDLSDRYRAVQRRYAYGARIPVVKKIARDNLVYEPGKCIKCGICVRTTAKYDEKFGFTFIGRGFQVEIGVPFDESVESALVKTMALVAEACPTGALSSLKTQEP